MRRILIATEDETISQALLRRLRESYAITVCRDSEQTCLQLENVSADVLILDLELPGEDWLCRLRALRASGSNMDIMVIATYYSDYIQAQLASLNICYPMRKPYNVNMMIAHIKQLMLKRCHPNDESWCVENEAEILLLTMGFRPGPERYGIVREALLYYYVHPNCAITKEIYQPFARRYGGTDKRIDKAIRDAISEAYNVSDKSLWRMFFIPRKPPKPPYPSNEEFLSRMALCLIQRTRICKPSRLYLDKAE